MFKRRQIARLLGLGLGLLPAFTAIAETSPNTTTTPSSAAGAPLLPPLPPSPIVQFRQLLEAAPEEQARQLAARPERSRHVLEAKLREYQLLAPEERERRLRATELRWYLHPLLELAPSDRAARLAAIPDTYGPLIQKRLQQWDQLPADIQREILDHETTIQYFLRLQSGTTAQQDALRESLPPAERAKL